MLLVLAQWLQEDFGFLRVFNYITFRAVMATVTALLIGLAAGPWVISKLAALKMGQAVRTDGPQTSFSEIWNANYGWRINPDRHICFLHVVGRLK
jgi:hypothetical protein